VTKKEMLERASRFMGARLRIFKRIPMALWPPIVVVIAALLVTMVAVQPEIQAEETQWGAQWNVELIGANWAYELGYRGQGVKIAVLDTGLDYEHEDLSDAVYDGTNFAHGPSSAYHDSFGHGSHVGGIVASRTEGFMGVAPEAEVYSVKVMSDYGYGYWFWVKEGIEWAIENDMDIVTMSFGGVSVWTPRYVQVAMKKAVSEGILLIASAGNQGDSPWKSAPASYPEVMAVGAVDWNLDAPEWSARQDYVEIAAPGVIILSTCTGYLRDLYSWAGFGSLDRCWLSGTSMSAPHVAGAAAVLMSSPIPRAADLDRDGTWDGKEVRYWLTATAYDVGPTGRDNATGYGIVDLASALSVGFKAPADFDVSASTSHKTSLLIDWESTQGGFTIVARFT
jgi:subtilisin